MAETVLWTLSVVAARSAIVLVFLTTGFRVLGKRDFGGMNVYDLVVILLLANAVQNAMTLGSGLLSVGIVSSATLLVSERLIGSLFSGRPSWEARLVGTPTVIVDHGRPVRENMRREGITDEELAAALRSYGLIDLSEVRLAVLEVDGSLSIVPREKSAEGAPVQGNE